MEPKEIISRRLWSAESHRAWSRALSLAAAVAVRVDSFGQGMPRAAVVNQEHFISISLSVEEVSSARAGNGALGCGEPYRDFLPAQANRDLLQLGECRTSR